MLLDVYVDDFLSGTTAVWLHHMYIFASLHPHKNVSKKNLAAKFGDLSTSVTVLIGTYLPSVPKKAEAPTPTSADIATYPI